MDKIEKEFAKLVTHDNWAKQKEEFKKRYASARTRYLYKDSADSKEGKLYYISSKKMKEILKAAGYKITETVTIDITPPKNMRA